MLTKSSPIALVLLWNLWQGTTHGAVSVDVLPESSPTYPAGTPTSNFDFFSPPPVAFTESADPTAPFRDESVVFKGWANGGSQEQQQGAYLIYRFRIEFEEEVVVNRITVGAAGDHVLGGDSAILRLLDHNRAEVATVSLRGFNVYGLHTLDAAGIRGQTFFLDEFDYSMFWRYRDHISIDYVPVGDSADFDGDGDVDGDDFLAWQTGFGTQSGAQKSDGDYDNDGDVDGDDFLGWQVEFGSGGNAAADAVPEPSSLLLLLAALSLSLTRPILRNGVRTHS